MSRPSHVDRELHRAIGARLRAARTSRDWSQERLAEEIGVLPETISKYETGRVALSLDRLREVADVLGVAPGVLLGFTGGLPDDEAAVLTAWRLLDDEGKTLVLRVAQRLGGG